MELSAVLAKVQKLIQLAEHPNTPEAEAKAARLSADALMLKYAIDEITLDLARPIEERSRPNSIEIALTSDSDSDTDLLYRMNDLARTIAAHCRCLVRPYTRYDREEHAWTSTVYGYESDLRYFEFLYTTLRLHMIGAIRPAVDKSATLDENSYNLHNAGYNWAEMAIEFYGWRETSWLEGDKEDTRYYRNRETDERMSYWDLAGKFKKAYYRECKRRGEEPLKLRPGTGASYRADAVSGYGDRIRQRLRETVAARGSGTEIVLAVRMDDLQDFYRECDPNSYTRCPECGKLSVYDWKCDVCGVEFGMKPPDAQECPRCKANPSGRCRTHPGYSFGKTRPLNRAGYAAGVSRANTADLGRSAAGHTARPIGG